jgi:hypothetical protein
LSFRSASAEYVLWIAAYAQASAAQATAEKAYFSPMKKVSGGFQAAD